jgi:hypothetical protein
MRVKAGKKVFRSKAMARTTTVKKTAKGNNKERRKTGTSVARPRSSTRNDRSDSDGFDASEAFIKLLQSPLVAELVAVAATAALAALAEQGFNSGSTRRGKAGNAVKAAGKAAAAAVGRRLGSEIDEIRSAASAAKAGAAA